MDLNTIRRLSEINQVADRRRLELESLVNQQYQTELGERAALAERRRRIEVAYRENEEYEQREKECEQADRIADLVIKRLRPRSSVGAAPIRNVLPSESEPQLPSLIAESVVEQTAHEPTRLPPKVASMAVVSARLSAEKQALQLIAKIKGKGGKGWRTFLSIFKKLRLWSEKTGKRPWQVDPRKINKCELARWDLRCGDEHSKRKPDHSDLERVRQTYQKFYNKIKPVLGDPALEKAFFAMLDAAAELLTEKSPGQNQKCP